MKTVLRKLVRDAEGQNLVEYGVVLAVIGLGAGLAAIAVANNVSTIYSTVTSVIRVVIG